MLFPPRKRRSGYRALLRMPWRALSMVPRVFHEGWFDKGYLEFVYWHIDQKNLNDRIANFVSNTSTTYPSLTHSLLLTCTSLLRKWLPSATSYPWLRPGRLGTLESSCSYPLLLNKQSLLQKREGGLQALCHSVPTPLRSLSSFSARNRWNRGSPFGFQFRGPDSCRWDRPGFDASLLHVISPKVL